MPPLCDDYAYVQLLSYTLPRLQATGINLLALFAPYEIGFVPSICPPTYGLVQWVQQLKLLVLLQLMDQLNQLDPRMELVSLHIDPLLVDKCKRLE